VNKPAFQKLYSALKNLLNMRVGQHLLVALFSLAAVNPFKPSRKFALSRQAHRRLMPGKFWKKFAAQ